MCQRPFFGQILRVHARTRKENRRMSRGCWRGHNEEESGWVSVDAYYFQYVDLCSLRSGEEFSGKQLSSYLRFLTSKSKYLVSRKGCYVERGEGNTKKIFSGRWTSLMYY